MRKSMLIVDDSEADRYIVKRLVDKSKCFDDVYSLNDGEEAYDLFKNEKESKEKLGDGFPPAVVILDINMPRMNGFEFLEKFSELPNYKQHNILFVAMLTSSQDEKDKQRAKDFPFVEMFLSKPFKKEYVAMMSEKVDQRLSSVQ